MYDMSEEMFEALLKEGTSTKPMQSRQDTFSLISHARDLEKGGFLANDEQQKRFFASTLSALQDPNKRLCHRRILGFMSIIASEMEDWRQLPFNVVHNRSVLRFHQQAFLRAVADWVFEPRETKECKQLFLGSLKDTDVKHCARHCTDIRDLLVAQIHNVGDANILSRTHPLPSCFFITLSAVLSIPAAEKKTAKVAKKVKTATDVQGLDAAWPRNMSDLTSFSFESILVQMDRWIDAYPQRYLPIYLESAFYQRTDRWIDAYPFIPEVYSILASLMALYPHQVIPVMAQTPGSIPRHALDHLLSIKESRHQQNPKGLLTQISYIARYYEEILYHPNFDKLLSFDDNEEYQSKILSTCSWLLDTIPDMLSITDQIGGVAGNYDLKAKASIKTFERLGSTLHAAKGMPFTKGLYHKRILQLSRAKRDMANDAIKSAVSCFIGLSEWQRCAAPRCPGTGEGVLMKCSGCKRVFFCSKSCQSAAWREGEAPHRELCKIVARLVEATSIPENPTIGDVQDFYRAVDGNDGLESDCVELKRCYDRLTSALSG
ncbi:hypothetical protein BDZ89DRAFT_253929 [Hymenopellis radicata]|nr:hypothetical protein BDZ89DRAFT_253929 [Hymenopellis radicata]